MNLYKSIFHKLVEPLNGFEAQHILAAGNLLKHNIGDDKKIAYAIGEVVMRIGRLRQFAENILSDDFEERAAQHCMHADGWYGSAKKALSKALSSFRFGGSSRPTTRR